jgi:chemotaxis protein methyltransferase CheR
MKLEDFDLFFTLLKQRSGLILTREKTYFLESRMLPVIRKHNLRSMADLAQTIRGNRDETLMCDVTEAMMANDTLFFRDHKIYEHLRNVVLPQLRAARQSKKHLRIWSAATASGQEAYSLAMLLADAAADFEDWKIDIIGTDLSKAMIARAKAGTYTQLEVQRGLPIRMLIKYFENIGGDKWQVKEGIRQMVQFRDSNLLHDFGPVGVFDFVLCRNITGSFEELMNKRVLEAIHAVMAPDGLLLLGASENALGVGDKFTATSMSGLYSIGAHEALANQVGG